MPRFDLEERLLEYAAAIVRLTQNFDQSYAGHHVANQLLRSGTSPLANHGDAESAKSKRDFVYRLRTCLQELCESLRWLKLSNKVPLTKNTEEVSALIRETDELIRTFYTSIQTAQKRGKE